MADVQHHLTLLPGWQKHTVNSEDRLTRSFAFKDYRAGLNFVQAVGDAAEEANHHPLIEIAWGSVTVSWWTHSIGGLHLNDFIMAARSDALYQDNYTK